MDARDIEFVKKAIELARQSRHEPGRVTPFVGAVATRDHELLETAYRGELKPGEHAEFTLVERKLKDAKLAGATIFTTLEPCTKRGAGKIPCAEQLIGEAHWARGYRHIRPQP